MDTSDTQIYGRTPLLWWIAGADADVLAQCPRGDRIFVQHLGISLIGAFLFVFLISTASFRVAFPDLSGSLIGTIVAPTFAFLIGAMVFLIDRLFIQYDWDWQAAKQKRELARAAWEKAPLEERLAAKAMDSDWSRGLHIIRRFLVICSRVLLSAAIGLTIASFLELVIYKDEIKTIIQKLHYEENKIIYDEINTRASLLDRELEKAREERDRLLKAKASANSEFNKLALLPPPLPSDKVVSQLDARIAELRNKIAEEEGKARRYNEDMVAEQRGTLINPWNSGVQGFGPRYQTALALKSISDSLIAKYRGDIDTLETEKKRAVSNKDAEYEAAKKRADEEKSRLHTHIDELAKSESQAQARLSELENGRESALAEFASTLKSKPNFIPISFGVASQFRALRVLYSTYGSTFEMYMIKFLIMMLEMTPVLQKVLLSPTTLYAAKLDAIKRAGAYTHFDEELRMRQEHLKRKGLAARDEQWDKENIERIGRRGM